MTAEGEARKALSRLRRALEKSLRELEAVQGSLRHAEGEDFPQDAYEGAVDRISEIMTFVDDEGERLQAKVLQAGGLEPARIRRSSAREG